MENLVESLIAGLGGGISIFICFVVFAKDIFQKWIDNAFEKSSGKYLARFTNILQRKTEAYKTLLDNELSFYKEMNSVIANIIVKIQDFSYYLGVDEKHETKIDIERAKRQITDVLKCTMEMKNKYLSNEVYIHNSVADAIIKLITDIQNKTDEIVTIINQRTKKRKKGDSFRSIKEIENAILYDCKTVNMRIKERLESLSRDE